MELFYSNPRTFCRERKGIFGSGSGFASLKNIRYIEILVLIPVKTGSSAKYFLMFKL